MRSPMATATVVAPAMAARHRMPKGTTTGHTPAGTGMARHHACSATPVIATRHRRLRHAITTAVQGPNTIG